MPAVRGSTSNGSKGSNATKSDRVLTKAIPLSSAGRRSRNSIAPRSPSAHKPSRSRRREQRRNQRNARQHDDRGAQTDAGSDGANDNRPDEQAGIAGSRGGGDTDRRR